ncbi:MAG: GGDEF domain-containing protein, partial [Steroidobacteraceae bacterium]
EEVRELTQQLVQAQSEALLDPLTGLKNRRGFERVVQELATLDERLKGSALLLTDVDHFKHINDTHGHLLGDKVLRAIGHELHSNLKGRDLAARWGGDEFAVLLRQTTPTGAAILAEQLRTAVAGGRMQGGDGREISGAVTLSIGVAVAGDQESFEALLARADRALYAAKRGGRNQVAVAAAESG